MRAHGGDGTLRSSALEYKHTLMNLFLHVENVKPSADELERMFYVIINTNYSFKVDGDDLPQSSGFLNVNHFTFESFSRFFFFCIFIYPEKKKIHIAFLIEIEQ